MTLSTYSIKHLDLKELPWLKAMEPELKAAMMLHGEVMGYYAMTQKVKPLIGLSDRYGTDMALHENAYKPALDAAMISSYLDALYDSGRGLEPNTPERAAYDKKRSTALSLKGLVEISSEEELAGLEKVYSVLVDEMRFPSQVLRAERVIAEMLREVYLVWHPEEDITRAVITSDKISTPVVAGGKVWVIQYPSGSYYDGIDTEAATSLAGAYNFVSQSAAEQCLKEENITGKVVGFDV